MKTDRDKKEDKDNKTNKTIMLIWMTKIIKPTTLNSKIINKLIKVKKKKMVKLF